MTAPRTVFEHPRAHLLPDPVGRRKYGNVDNLMEVSVGRSVYFVAVAVPTELFTFMLEVGNIPPEMPATLAIDRHEDRYVFSLLAGDHLFDLWSYSAKSLPAWILNPTYREKSG